MKKIVFLFLSVVLLFCFYSCSSDTLQQEAEVLSSSINKQEIRSMAINDFYGSYSRSKSDSLPVNKDFLEKMYTDMRRI